MTLAEIATALHEKLPALAPLEIDVTGVSTDTREIERGDLFVALRGENFDGHAFLSAAFERGAVAAVVDADLIKSLPEKRGILIGAKHGTRSAYGLIARAWRRKFDIPVIGVTGSVGKTTTKEMLATCLSRLGPVLKTRKNENNEVGVPKLLLDLTDQHRAVVVEMGMRGAGQIANLAEIAEPTGGIITRIGESHVELLGSVDAIATAKGELVEALPARGVAVLNADDPFTPRIAAKAGCRVATFGTGADATIRASECRFENGSWIARVHLPAGTIMREMRVPSPSRHDIHNALAAVLMAVELGVDPIEAVAAVSEFENVGMRMDVLTTRSGATVLSDCYNASPASTISAIETLAEYPAHGRKIAFLGDMKELGDSAPSMHASVAAYAAKMGIAELYGVGPMYSENLHGSAMQFDDSAAAAAWAGSWLRVSKGDVVLVKGSRSMTMERIVEALTQCR
jgi:UDP-N-acetylmuramoyl-tripeptide--D-alanyl-D-alanine ligase